MKRIVVSLFVLTFAAAGAGWWVLRPTRITWLTDADTIRESAATAPLREVLWQRPVPLADLIHTQADEFEPRVSADGGTLFFVRGKPGHNTDIYVCMRDRTGWSDPAPVAEVNTEHDELGPEPSADGQSLYFYSDRPGSVGGYDIWIARKSENGWQAPTNLGAAVNTVYNEYGPALSPDGRTLCFSANRPKPGDAQPSDDAWKATVREDLYRHDYDLYAAAITDAGFQPAAPVDALNSPNNDGAPAYSPIGDFLYFSSDRPAGHGGFDLYRSRILRGKCTPPENLGGIVNTAANELDPALDVGGYALHFSSDRPPSDTSKAGQPAAARYHLYRTFSREVFHDVEVRRPVINWTALWKQIGPNLMWALLALIIFILLLAMMRDLHRRRLSLLARCLIVSLMIHALLMLWFNAVKVTATIATAMRKSGPIQVALSSAARSGDLSIQIRGGLTQADTPPAAAPRLDRAAPTIAPTISATPVEIPVEKSSAAPREVSSVRSRVVDASPHPVAAPPRHAVAADLSVASADYLLPADQARSNAPENSEPAPVPAEAMKIGRNRLRVPTSQPAVSSQGVQLAIEGREPGGQAFESLAKGAPPADAKPTGVMPFMMQSTITAAVFGATNTIEPALPMGDAARRQIVGEVASIPATEVSAPTRAEAAFVAISKTCSSAIQRLSPGGVAVPTSQPSLVAFSGIGSLDTRPGFGNALSRIFSASFTLGDGQSPGGSSSDGGKGNLVDVALPAGGSGGRVSDSEVAAASPGSSASGALAPATRAGVSLAGSAAPSTIVNLTPGSAGSPAPGSQSLIAGGSPFGTGRGDGRGDGLSAGRIPITSSANLPSSSSLQTTADQSPFAIRLPDETAPPPVPTPPTPAVGKIHGRVIDDATGERLAAARIQLDLPGGATMIVSTDATGRYQLSVPELPDFFALSASKPGYLPDTRNVANRSVVGRSMRLNFSLRPQSLQVIALEDSPVVHHLGNDAYEGRINSQFQREAEGRTYRREFNLVPGQIVVGQAEVELLAKGVQCPHKIRINGNLLETRLDLSPEDGSFGAFTAIFDSALLHEGTNTLEIRAITCNGDLDDFEFVNMQIRLLAQSH